MNRRETLDPLSMQEATSASRPPGSETPENWSAGLLRPSEDSVSSTSSRSICQRLCKYIADPRRIMHKYFLLSLLVMFCPGPYFQDCVIGAYKGDISDRMGLSSTQFSLLFALSTVTGIFCGPIQGMISLFGRTRVALASGFVCALGSLLTILGFQLKIFSLMVVGRVFFWAALYSILQVQTVLCYGLFKGTELSIAIACVITFCRIAALAGYFLSGLMLTWFNGVEGPLWLSVVLVFLSFVSTLLFAYFFRGSATAQAVRPFMGNSKASKEFSLKLLKEAPKSVAAVSVAIGCLYGTIFPFEAIADDMLQTEYGYDADAAGIILSICPGIAILSPCSAPLIGATLPRKIASCVIGLGCLVASMILLSIQQSWVPIPAFIIAGAGYTISVTGLWTLLPLMVSLAVPKDRVKSIEGLMTGISYVCVAMGQFISNFVSGIIKDRTGSYRWVCVFLAGLAGVGLFFVVFARCWYVPAPTVEGYQEEGEYAEAEELPSVELEPSGVDRTDSRGGLRLADDYFSRS